ncbi:MAG: GntR family transcriptional regulator [Rhodospirillales bacterium]
MTKTKNEKPTASSGAERAYAAIKLLAISYGFPPGQNINEKQLSEQFGVSRTPIREALNRLAVEGLLKFIPNKGYSARDLNVTEIVELFEVRLALEIAAFRYAVDRATDEDIASLRQHWRSLGESYDGMTISEITANDEDFHERLAALSNNKQLLQSIRQIAERIRFCRVIDLENRTRHAPLYDEHIDILNALETRDADSGAKALKDHIAMSRDKALEVIKEGLARIYLRGQELDTQD